MGCKGLAILCVLVSVFWTGAYTQTIDGEMPPEIVECVRRMVNGSEGSMVYTSTEDTHIHCLQMFLWKTDNVQWSGFNITENDKRYINSLMGSYVRRGRQKRQAGPGGGGRFPMTGFRIRREYRRLSDGERFAFHAAVNQLKTNGRYDTFANLHQGIVVTSAHNGPNFLGWHRVYLSLFEEALRMFNPRVSLPYWDSTMDFDMDDPVQSIIWSTPFLGNGDGFVTRGPFANWMTPAGQLTRNIGGGSRLFSKAVINSVLTRCRMREITNPTAVPQFNLELAHGGPHVWVGGQMMGLNTAAHDPVFFMHHAFVDYVWELFRIRQATFCGVNPSRDYPPTMGEHAGERPMDGFPAYRNVDGIRAYWTRFWYRYERSPSCSMWRPFCGTPYLRCDMRRRRCVSVPSMEAPGPEAAGAMGFAAGGMATRGAGAVRARAQASTVRVGPVFQAPPADPRTQDAQMMMPSGRFRRQVNQTEERKFSAKNNDTGRSKSTSNFGPVFDAPPKDERTFIGGADSFPGGVVGAEPFDRSLEFGGFGDGTFFAGAEPMPVLPAPEFQEPDSVNNMLRTPPQNTFFLNGHTDVNKWAFIPVKVTFINEHSRFPQDAARFSTNSESRYTTGRPTCVQDPSGAIQVKVQSSGLNYYGTYTDNALVDQHLPFDSTITYVGIKSPEYEPTKVIVSASHSCGLMCKPFCFGLDPSSQTESFKPCSGVLNISANDRNVYGRTYDEAVILAWQGSQTNGAPSENVRIVFSCSDTDESPWLPSNSNRTVY